MFGHGGLGLGVGYLFWAVQYSFGLVRDGFGIERDGLRDVILGFEEEQFQFRLSRVGFWGSVGCVGA